MFKCIIINIIIIKDKPCVFSGSFSSPLYYSVPLKYLSGLKRLVAPGLDRQRCLMLANVLVYLDVTQFVIN